MRDNNSTKREMILVGYKLLYDILFLLLLSFGAMLFAEAILPGLISSHISFTKLIVAILFDFAAIIYLRGKTEKSAAEAVLDPKPTRKIYFYLLAAFLLVLIAFSIRHFNRIVLAVILIATLFLFYYLFGMFFNKE